MGVSVHWSEKGNDGSVLTVAGQSEVEALWFPIIRQKQLVWLELALTAGVSVDPENYSQLLEEVAIVQQEIESRTAFVEDPVNPVYRCRRLYAILVDHPPSKGYSVYLG